MKSLFKIILLFGGISCLIGCGYRFGQGELPLEYKTISVPYVEGDRKGILTSALIKAVTSSGGFNYQSCGARLTLKVVLLDFCDDHIGFRYDRRKKGNLSHSIIPTETRISLLAKITLIEVTSGRVILGPVKISTSIDFDHDYYSSRNAVNIFSLGQLSNIDSAYEDVYQPLYESLAQKIVDYINNVW